MISTISSKTFSTTLNSDYLLSIFQGTLSPIEGFVMSTSDNSIKREQTVEHRTQVSILGKLRSFQSFSSSGSTYLGRGIWSTRSEYEERNSRRILFLEGYIRIKHSFYLSISFVGKNF